jgi:hypothetical protein
MNLPGNVAKFTESGTIKLTVSIHGSSLGDRHERHRHREKRRDSISSLPLQPEDAKTKHHEGTGLGLRSAKSCGAYRRNDLDDKRLRKGTTFIVSCRYKSWKKRERATMQNKKKDRIDDDEMHLYTTKELLQNERLRSVPTKIDGAINRVRDFHPDLRCSTSICRGSRRQLGDHKPYCDASRTLFFIHPMTKTV